VSLLGLVQKRRRELERSNPDAGPSPEERLMAVLALFRGAGADGGPSPSGAEHYAPGDISDERRVKALAALFGKVAARR